MSSEQSYLYPLIHEEIRLQSFVNWPVPNIVSPESLARAGFYYLRQSDSTKCIYCNAILGNWEVGDDPDRAHVRFSPQCIFVQQVIRHRLNRLGAEIDLGPNVSINKFSEGELGIHLSNRPHVSKFAILESRLSSFDRWPKALKQTPRMLADAGFYYLQIGDSVKCFACGGAVRDWEPTDDPWIEHAKWFPNCSYLLFVKAHDYVNSCRRFMDSSTKDTEVASNISNSDNESEKCTEDSPSTSANSNATAENPLPTDKLNRVPEKSRMCRVCMSAEISVVFLPCGHLTVCVTCAPNLEYCPICGSPNKGFVKVVLP